MSNEYGINGYLILEPYKGSKKIEMEVSKGFGTVKARNTIIGLELLKKSIIINGGNQLALAKGSIVYFLEETLSTRASYTSIMNFEKTDEKFILGFFSDAVYVESLDE